MKLFIGNKNYSSWSMRPWLALKVKNIDFEEVLVPFDMAAGNPEFRKFSPTGKVPCLQDGTLTIWESLAILEYAADKYPDAQLWPSKINERATARAVSHEMHGGFSVLRNACPMNMSRTPSSIEIDEALRKDVSRIEELWDQCLQTSGGPFLFGEFTNADAMFAPVVNRLEVYCLSEHDAVARYASAMKGLAAWQEWETAGRAEPWYVAEDEV